jgi:hypothetical protein
MTLNFRGRLLRVLSVHHVQTDTDVVAVVRHEGDGGVGLFATVFRGSDSTELQGLFASRPFVQNWSSGEA